MLRNYSLLNVEYTSNLVKGRPYGIFLYVRTQLDIAAFIFVYHYAI